MVSPKILVLTWLWKWGREVAGEGAASKENGGDACRYERAGRMRWVFVLTHRTRELVSIGVIGFVPKHPQPVWRC